MHSGVKVWERNHNLCKTALQRLRSCIAVSQKLHCSFSAVTVQFLSRFSIWETMYHNR